MKTISVFTSTRAEYCLLYNLIKRINNAEDLKLDLIVSGTHLSYKYGHTIDEIYKDGFPISETIEILDEKEDVDEAISKALIGSSGHFKRVNPDMLIVLGDRYEVLGPVIAAANAKIPIAHIHGGETTEGAVDEEIRHAVTKFSYLHFTGCEEYKKRVLQLGETEDRVFNVGTLGTENIMNQPLMTLEELGKNLDINNLKLEKYGLVTFHPVTLEHEDASIQMKELMDAMLSFEDMFFIVTKSNADAGGQKINDMWDEFEKKYPNKIKVVFSLGLIRYLSAMKYCEAVIGNSSSGILEAPVMRVPTINIGDRQKGRIQTESIINCGMNKNEIISAMNKAFSKEFHDKIKDMPCIYGDGKTSERIIEKIRESFEKGIDLKKKFNDIY